MRRDALHDQMMSYAIADAESVLTNMGFEPSFVSKVVKRLSFVNEADIPPIFKEYAEEEFGSLHGFNPIDWMRQNPTVPLEMQKHDGS